MGPLVLTTALLYAAFPMLRILIPDAQFAGEPDVERAVLGLDAVFDVHRASTPAEVPQAAWAACDGILLWHVMPIDATLVPELTRCRLVVRMGIGYEKIDLAACAAHGIAACNVPTYDMTDVVNSTIGMTLALIRGLLSYHDALKADLSRGWRWEGPPLVRRVRGQRFGVVGCGRIGTAVLMRARALGMDAAYYDPYLPVSHEMSLALGRFPSLEALLGWADVVSLHTPLTPETTRMIDRAAIGAMKPGMVLVNCARGGLVDLDALAEALRSGRIAGAALDVFPEEPPAPHPLLAAWAADEAWIRGRLCLTPHASWYSRETMEDLRRDAATTARDYFAKGTLRNCVNAHLLAP